MLVLFGADAADTVLDRSGTEALRRLLRFGPETGVHVLGWWRSAPRLRSLLTMSAVIDDVGAWVALDVQGAELQQLAARHAVHLVAAAGPGAVLRPRPALATEVVIVPGELP